MIEGVKIHIKTDELKKHLLEKVKFHEEKSIFYTAQVSNLEKGESNAPTVGGEFYNASNNPISSLRNSAKSHKNKAEYFQFIVDHLVPDETYELTENDLSRLEILSQYF